MCPTLGQVGDLWCARDPTQSIRSPFIKPVSHGEQERLVGESFQAWLHMYQAGHVLFFSDLTVALANPIKYFNAHDKKSMKLKEVTGSLPEVCVT